MNRAKLAIVALCLACGVVSLGACTMGTLRSPIYGGGWMSDYGQTRPYYGQPYEYRDPYGYPRPYGPPGMGQRPYWYAPQSRVFSPILACRATGGKRSATNGTKARGSGGRTDPIPGQFRQEGCPAAQANGRLSLTCAKRNQAVETSFLCSKIWYVRRGGTVSNGIDASCTPGCVHARPRWPGSGGVADRYRRNAGASGYRSDELAFSGEHPRHQ